jgi:hypothetical protein
MQCNNNCETSVEDMNRLERELENPDRCAVGSCRKLFFCL